MIYKAVDEEVIRYAIRHLEQDKAELQKQLDAVNERIKEAQSALSLDLPYTKPMVSNNNLEVQKGARTQTWPEVILDDAKANNGVASAHKLKEKFPEAPRNTFHAALAWLKQKGYKVTSEGEGQFRIEATKGKGKK